MSDAPTPEQLDHLLGTADRRRLTPAEAALLRTGVQQLRAVARPCECPGPLTTSRRSERSRRHDAARRAGHRRRPAVH
ncbi:hypothetical protein HUT16_27355 [Kitasatospora sp. NA04385]|uniref:hypothetical protein n=1 Tax=Kitasatospora sp. NA04385 TaxID=2742135 RepID=UPI001590129B|nr:hypothetical protein [Kitasatospora sp. NA04385]QKW22298.1 hypothetical protein HUT16_27355 [Kitasatospora sp. NA04385]